VRAGDLRLAFRRVGRGWNWSDPDTGQVMACFQGVVENPDRTVSATAPSECVDVLAGAFTVRPS